MTHRRRNSKRNRNKSSPQTYSSLKKYRVQAEEKVSPDSVQESVEELTEEPLQADTNCPNTPSTPNTPPAPPTPSTPTMSKHNTVEHSNSNMNQTSNHGNDNMETVGHQDNSAVVSYDQCLGSYGSSQHVPLPAQHIGPPPQHPVVFSNQMDPNMFGGGMAPHMVQSPGPMSQYSQSVTLSEEDIMRIAMKTKSLLTKEIEEVVQSKVALAVQPYQIHLSRMQKELNSVKSELATLKGSIEKVNIKNDDLEQYSRRSCLRISGIPEENQDEDVHSLVLELAHQIGSKIKPGDIDRAHRVGKMHDIQVNDKSPGLNASEETIPKGPFRGREIIVKFQSHGARLNLLQCRTNLKDSHLKMFINEDLTKSRKTLAYQCRQLKRDNKIKKTWVYGGNVYIKDQSDSELCIKSATDLKPYLPAPQIAQNQQPGPSHGP